MTSTPNRTDDERDETAEYSRRRVLAVAGTTLGAAVAGCVGGREQSTSGPQELLPNTVHGEEFSRIANEDLYQLRYRWEDTGVKYETGVDVLKRRYREASSSDRGIAEVFRESLTDETAAALSRSLVTGLSQAGVDSQAARIRRAVEFVRSMPYVTDRESTGSPEYPRYVPETLVEHEGDCEDYSAVLAGILAAEPFGLDPALVILPGHAAPAVSPEAFEGRDGSVSPEPTLRVGGREYVYLDTTYDVELGRLPIEHHGDEVVAVYDDGWRLGDPVAALKQLRMTVGGGDS